MKIKEIHLNFLAQKMKYKIDIPVLKLERTDTTL
jgi:hypothetical protein